MKRRTFIITGGVIGGGLLVGWGGFNYYVNKRLKEFSAVGMGEGDSLNAYVRIDRKSTRLNSSHIQKSRMPSSA